MARPSLVTGFLACRLVISQIYTPQPVGGPTFVLFVHYSHELIYANGCSQNYDAADYAQEFGQLVNAMNNWTSNTTNSNGDVAISSHLSRASKLLVGPNIISGSWTPEMVWDTGFAQEYSNNLAALAVEQYGYSTLRLTYVKFFYPPAILPIIVSPTLTVARISVPKGYSHPTSITLTQPASLPPTVIRRLLLRASESPSL